MEGLGRSGVHVCGVAGVEGAVWEVGRSELKLEK